MRGNKERRTKRHNERDTVPILIIIAKGMDPPTIVHNNYTYTHAHAHITKTNVVVGRRDDSRKPKETESE